MQLGDYYADFLCRSLKLVVECDGISHDRSDAWMRAEGYTVLRFTNADVLGETEGVIATIRTEIDRLQSKRT